MRTRKIYTKQENQILKQLANEPGELNIEKLKQFCQTYNRSFTSARSRAYSLRRPTYRKKKQRPVVTPKATTPKALEQPVQPMTGRQFVFPIKDFTIKTKDGKSYLVVNC